VLDCVDESVTAGGIRGLLRRGESVVITPVPGGDTSVPEASISRSGLVASSPKVTFSLPGMSGRDVERWLLAAGLSDGAPRRSSAFCTYSLPSDATAEEIVDLAVRGLRALRAEPVDDRWEFSVQKPAGD
jgi:hypothetical protein